MSTTHLGKPHRFYRGFNNLKYSPVCREGLGIAIFIGMLGLHILCSLPANTIFQGLTQSLFGWDVSTLAGSLSAFATGFGVTALAGAGGGMYYMYRCYRIKARPFWNHWQVATDFGGHALALGSALVGTAGVILALLQGTDYGVLLSLTAGGVAVGQALHAIGLRAHASAMNGQKHEGAASHYIQTTTFGKTYIARNLGLGVNIALALATMLLGGFVAARRRRRRSLERTGRLRPAGNEAREADVDSRAA